MPTTPSQAVEVPAAGVMRDLHVLEEIQKQVLWLAIRMVDHANRRGESEVKVGGHQASSASVVSIMTALWFGHLQREDKVAVKPHAAPVYHAIKYLTGDLDVSYLTRLRAKGGLQAYPSRTKDPDVSDFSTGSVGLGAVAPLFSAAVHRYLSCHFGPQPSGRFIAIAGDAELDEGNVWEAIADPALQGLGSVMLVIDLNRQSLDRVVPGIQARRLRQFFENAGWHVVEAKYGNLLEHLFAGSGGDSLRRHIDEMSNEEYQSLFAYEGLDLRKRFLANAEPAVKRAIEIVDDADLAAVIQNLGGHDLGVLLDAYRECDEVTDRPSVVFAYTIKGWRLPIAGDPLNHSALLSPHQLAALREELGVDVSTEWSRFPAGSSMDELCRVVGERLKESPTASPPMIQIPKATDAPIPPRASTQETFGRVLVRLGREADLADRLVTLSPDVAISTNLGGWINEQGVFSPHTSTDYFPAERLLRWVPSPKGRHIELGISEMNLFLMLGQLGLAYAHHGIPLVPIGTVYDPFVLRGLDALIYSLYSGARFLIVGTPSGITLAPEGGAHQSSITPSVMLELPGIMAWEPAYGKALDWVLCDAISRVSDPRGESTYIRCTSRPIDQGPFNDALNRLGEEELRTSVLAGGYRLKEPNAGVPVILAASGAVMPEVLAAADLLDDEGVAATVIDVTSLDLLFRGWQRPLAEHARKALADEPSTHLRSLLKESERRVPIVTVHDASPHSMAWLGSVFGQRVVPVGVDRFGESGSISDLYATFGLLPGQIANAALVALDSARLQ